MERKFEKLVVATVVLILTLTMLMIPKVSFASKTQSIPNIQDTIPGYWETSEYMEGKIGVKTIFIESNGTIDPSTEDWTDAEMQKVMSEIQTALDWWASQNPNASVKFVTETPLKAQSPWESINHTESEFLTLVIPGVMRDLGYENTNRDYQCRNYVNDLRERLKTDWAFIIFVVDSSNDSDGAFNGGGAMRSALGGTYLYMTYDNAIWGIENMDRVCAHEIAHIFWAQDEYFTSPAWGGYLNVTNIPQSDCLMDQHANLRLSGASYGQNGTWGQIGWHDSNGNGIQDIVDTPQQVYFNLPTNIGNKFNFTGVAAVTPYPNKNPSTNNPQGRRDVTINTIQIVQYKIDNGTWLNATITPTTVHKLQKYPNTYIDKETFAIVNYTFLTPELTPGQHSVEIRAMNQWGIYGYANQTVTIQEFLRTDLNQDRRVDILDIFIVAMAFGSASVDDPKTPLDETKNWNATADLDKNGLINILDIFAVAWDFGRTT